MQKVVRKFRSFAEADGQSTLNTKRYPETRSYKCFSN